MDFICGYFKFFVRSKSKPYRLLSSTLWQTFARYFFFQFVSLVKPILKKTLNSSTVSTISMKTKVNKKVLLRERKRHTARRVASTPYVVLTGYPPQAGYPPQGTPPAGPGRIPPPPAAPLHSGKCCKALWDVGTPPGVNKLTKWNYYLPVVLRTRAVIIMNISTRCLMWLQCTLTENESRKICQVFLQKTTSPQTYISCKESWCFSICVGNSWLFRWLMRIICVMCGN